MIGTYLKALRLKSGYKQEYIASQLGISQCNVSQTESGKVVPPLATLDKYATFYKLGSIESLVENFFREPSAMEAMTNEEWNEMLIKGITVKTLKT